MITRCIYTRLNVFFLWDYQWDEIELFFSPWTSGIEWEQFSDGITVFLSEEDVQYARDHGVARLGEDVSNILSINFFLGYPS